MLFKSHEFLSMCVYRLIFIAVVAAIVAIVVVVLDDETVQNESERDRETQLKILKYLWEEPVARVMKIFQ